LTLIGAPDFQQQFAQTYTPIGRVDINGAGHQTLDIAPNLMPYHQAIQLYWVASLVSAGSPVAVSVTLGLSSLPVVQQTNIADGANMVAALPGSLVTTQGTSCVVDVSPSPLGVSPVTGSVFIFGITAPPLAIPAKRLEYIGLGINAGAPVAAGLTVTALAAPPAGTYYRIKCLSCRFSGAPAIGTALIWRRTSDSTLVVGHSGNGADASFIASGLDVEWSDGLDFQNGSAVASTAIVCAERWQV